MNDKEKADILRKAADIMSTEWGSEPIDEMREYADALDPPYKVDRSLRGWVLVVNKQGQKSMMYADANGIGYWSEHGTRFSWEDVELYGWKVTKLNVLHPGEVTVHVEDLERVLFCAEQTLRRRWPYLDDDNHYRKVKEAYDKALDNPEAELEREKNR